MEMEKPGGLKEWLIPSWLETQVNIFPFDIQQYISQYTYLS